MNWNAFYSGLLGTTLPVLAVSLLLLYLRHRSNRSQERLKNEFQQDTVKFTKWHERRVDSLLIIFNAFCDHLYFLKRALYFPHRDGICMDPMHDFRNTLERQLVHLDDKMAEKISLYQLELLQFWNWAQTTLAEKGDAARMEVQRKLDYEIPEYLPRLRKDINQFLDPNYKSSPETG